MAKEIFVGLLLGVVAFTDTESSVSPTSEYHTFATIQDSYHSTYMVSTSPGTSSKLVNPSITSQYEDSYATSVTNPQNLDLAMTQKPIDVNRPELTTGFASTKLKDDDIIVNQPEDEIYILSQDDTESYKENLQMRNSERVDMDENVIRNEGPVSTTERVLVWGEVGGVLLEVPQEGRGELGRGPLVLGGGGRGRVRSGPYFEEDNPATNITAPAGSTVLLDCKVAMLQDKTVTWAARRDDRLRLLTVGRQTYSTDPRLALSFRYPNNWRLQILKASKQDQGLYECQVSVHPSIIRQIYLTVISPEVSISDESGRSVVERYYKAGSSLQLTCSATQLLEPPSLLAWWQAGQQLTDGISCNVTGPDSAVCLLMLDQVSRSHAGTYTCGAFPPPGPLPVGAAGAPTPPPAPHATHANATVAVHVLHGNLLGVAVLPNTGKSTGATGSGYISLREIVVGFATLLFILNR